MDNNNACRRSVFDGSFPKFYDTTVAVFSLFKAKQLRKEAMSMLNIKQGANVLDIACGTGDFTMLLAEKVGEKGNVIGIDLSEKMISIAKKKSNKYPQITFRVNDFTDISYKNYFNTAVVGFAAHEVTENNRQRMYKEAYKALKKGGRLLVFDFTVPRNIIIKPFFFLFIKLLEPHGLNYLNEDHQKALKKAGFKRVGHRIDTYIESSVYVKP